MGLDPYSPTPLNIALWIASIPIALLYANALEWLLHKYVLHGQGRKKSSFWAFHWHDHHNHARRSGFYDESYKAPFWRWNSKSKELLALQGLNLLHLPLLLVAPVAYLTLLYTNINYYFVHRRAHLDPDWARAHLRWHYDHHMGLNQDANWCVTKPWFDLILGTRIPSETPEAQPA